MVAHRTTLRGVIMALTVKSKGQMSTQTYRFDYLWVLASTEVLGIELPQVPRANVFSPSKA